MTAEELARLKELESKATKGPWNHTGETGDGKRQFVESDMGKDNWNCCRLEVDSDDCDYEMAVANAELIPALRNAAPALIALAEWAERARSSLILIRVTAFHEACVRESADQLLAAYPEGE